MTLNQGTQADEIFANGEDATMGPSLATSKQLRYLVKDDSSSSNSLSNALKLLVSRSYPLSNWVEWNNQQYVKLYQAIQDLSNFPDDDELYITAETKEKSQEILDYLRAIGDVEPPRIFNQGDDCLVFSWAVGKFRKNLLAAVDEISLMIVDPINKSYSDTIISEDGVLDLSRLVKSMSISGISSGSSEN